MFDVDPMVCMLLELITYPVMIGCAVNAPNLKFILIMMFKIGSMKRPTG